jgi:hypothetical protein
LTASCFF